MPIPKIHCMVTPLKSLDISPKFWTILRSRQVEEQRKLMQTAPEEAAPVAALEAGIEAGA